MLISISEEKINKNKTQKTKIRRGSGYIDFTACCMKCCACLKNLRYKYLVMHISFF